MEYWISDETIDNILCVIDSNNRDRDKNFYGKRIFTCNIEYFIKDYKREEFIIIITNIYNYMEIIESLDKYEIFNNKDCYIEHIIDEEYPEQPFVPATCGIPQIDKVIHYCWFGKKVFPDHLQKCVDSWKKYCPDYKIVRWDESNYDIMKNKYMRDAYEAKMWGFVSDFARLDIVYHYGGIYLDTDVELIKPLDGLRENEMYCGFESNHSIAFGLGFGAVKKHRIIKKILDVYDKLVFDTYDGNPVPCPVYQTQALIEEGVKINNTFQKMVDFTVYPSEVMAPVGPFMTGSGITENTVSIHHFDASWVGNRLENREKLVTNREKYFQRAKCCMGD